MSNLNHSSDRTENPQKSQEIRAFGPVCRQLRSVCLFMSNKVANNSQLTIVGLDLEIKWPSKLMGSAYCATLLLGVALGTPASETSNWPTNGNFTLKLAFSSSSDWTFGQSICSNREDGMIVNLPFRAHSKQKSKTPKVQRCQNAQIQKCITALMH